MAFVNPFNTDDSSQVGTTAAFENGDGTGATAKAAPSMTHAWLIVIGALLALWLLGGVAFRTVRM